VVVPTTYTASLLLLLLSLVCFSIWPNLYKSTESVWRFELFSLDFALGGLLFACLAAYTLGILGPEMSFYDRLLVAGRGAEIWVVGTGFVLAFANLLLLASITLLGISLAVPLSFGIALVLTALSHFLSSPMRTLMGIAILLLFASVVAGLGVERTVITGPKRLGSLSNERSQRTKGRILAILGGCALGFVHWLLKRTSNPDFGPGPYATVLLLFVGVVISTPLLNFFFMNIKITGEPIAFRSYAAGGVRPHATGILSGFIFASGALAVSLALGARGDPAPQQALILIIPFLSCVVCAWLGLRAWKEFSRAPRKGWIGLITSLSCFVIGLVLAGSALAS
jgi:glucose uptake protein GlcU